MMTKYVRSHVYVLPINFKGGKTSHRTNLMYVEAEDIEGNGNLSVNIPKTKVK